MKVILTQDVEKLGLSHEVVVVADGFARNYLFPRSLAVAGTKSALANLENMRRFDERKQERLRGGAREQANKFEGKTLVFGDAHVRTGGRLYGSIGTADIAEAIKSQFDIEVDRKLVHLPETIRSEGWYTVPVKFHRDVVVQLKVKVGNPPAEVVAAPPTEEAPAEAEAAVAA